MDFKEYLIKKEKTGREILLTVLMYIAATVIAALGIMYFPVLRSFGGVVALVVVGAYYAAYMLSSKFNKEFEYVQTEEYFDIDVIFNKSQRKRLASFSVKNIELMASASDSEYNSILKERFDKVIDATTGHKDKDVYFVVYFKNGRTLLKIQPPEDMIKELHKYSPSKVHLKKD